MELKKMLVGLENLKVRGDLNIEISGINGEYLLLLNSYNKVLKQRNAYLKALNKKTICGKCN